MEREERDGGVMTIEDRDYKGDLDFETVKGAGHQDVPDRMCQRGVHEGAAGHDRRPPEVTRQAHARKVFQ